MTAKELPARGWVIVVLVVAVGCSTPTNQPADDPLPTVSQPATTIKVRVPTTTKRRAQSTVPEGNCSEIGHEFPAPPGDPRDRDGDGIACER